MGAQESGLASNADLKSALAEGRADFWEQLGRRTAAAEAFEDVWFLSRLRQRARRSGPPAPEATPLRVALLGGTSLFPFQELLEHFLAAEGIATELFVGEYDDYTAQILEPESELHAFRPEVLVLIPAPQRCRYAGGPADPRERVEEQAHALVRDLLGLCRTASERSGADVVLANFLPPAGIDLGPYRSKTLASDWSYTKLVNLELGLQAPGTVHLCDLEFLAARLGTPEAEDARAWFESKQPCSPRLLVDFAREAARVAASTRRTPKKVLVLDLDNTLWGDVIGDAGLEGIELGDTSPRGEAFKAFQRYVATLTRRGVVLAVASKNEHEIAMEPFEKHPEMVLRAEDIACFKANWEPKSENIRVIADELGLGLDSFVFVDDNRAEIEIVNQFVPEVATLHLGDDPSRFVRLLQDSGHFERLSITEADAARTGQYRAEAERRALASQTTDMDSYLSSLEMEARIRDFDETDLPRITQLINKSNQFNLTTRRRSQAEVAALAASADHTAFTLRLADRFSDHGLISVLVGERRDAELVLDTWLMSCRVLKRGVEVEALNELVARAARLGCRTLTGHYLPTKRNAMVRGLYPSLGFELVEEAPERTTWRLDVAGYEPRKTHIQCKSETA